MKLAFIDLGRHYGGVEIYMLSLIKAWISRGNECVILARKDSTFHQKLLEAGYEGQVLPVNFNRKSIKEARARLIAEQVELLHLNGINSGVFASLLRLPLKKVKQVTTVHGSASFDRAERNVIIQKVFVWLENKCLKKSARIIAVSGAIKNMLVERGIQESKIEVIYNGIKEFKYEVEQESVAQGQTAPTGTTQTEILQNGTIQEVAAQTGKEQAERLQVSVDNITPFKICFVGRLEVVKGCEYLIRALAQMKEKNFRCDIYGEGSLKEELIWLAEELQIKDKLVFKGFSDKVRAGLNQYDMLVQPSLYESFSLTVAEAMNACTLVVCSDVGGMSELVIHKETGLKFEACNVDELADNIVWAMEHPADVQIMTEKAFERYRTMFRDDVMQDKTFRLFEELCNEV